MKNSHEKGFMCGPYALQQILKVSNENPELSKLIESKSSTKGFSLAQLHQLATESVLNYQIAKRTPGSLIHLNSVIHWKLNHYGALLKQKNGRFLIQDST